MRIIKFIFNTTLLLRNLDKEQAVETLEMWMCRRIGCISSEQKQQNTKVLDRPRIKRNLMKENLRKRDE